MRAFASAVSRLVRSCRTVVVAGFVLAVAGTAAADTIHVQPGVYPTIQSAIDAASVGDEIIVAPGVYYESIDFLGKAITVRGALGAEDTTIDASFEEGAAVHMEWGETRNSILEGFTITGGYGAGGGIEIHGSPTIRECVVADNYGYVAGGIAVAPGSNPLIERCRIEGNSAAGDFRLGGSSGTGGLSFDGCAGEVRDCEIRFNNGWNAGGVSINSADIEFVNCVIANNYSDGIGGGVAVNGTAATELIHCTIAQNEAYFGGGGIGINYGTPTISNSIIWGNLPDGIAFTGLRGSITTVQFSDVQGGWNGAGVGNISADPLFRDEKFGDYRPAGGSSCIDAANNALVPEGVNSDLDGRPRFIDDPATADCPYGPGECGAAPIADMGAYEFCGGADRIVLFGVPGSATAGEVLTPVVLIVDPCGEIVTDDDRTITLSLIDSPTGAPLLGNVTVQTWQGVAVWSSQDALRILKAGAYYRLRATAGGPPMSTSNVSDSNYFDILPGPVDHLAFVTQPDDTTAGDAIQPAVGLFDSYENLVPDDLRLIVLSIGANPGGATLGGAFFALTEGGIASWSFAEHVNITIAAGAYTLVAHGSGPLGREGLVVESEPFDIAPGPAHRLAFTTQPSDAMSGMPITAAVSLLDAFGNVASFDEELVVLTLDSNPGHAVLGGTTAVATSKGVATWSGTQNLHITVADAGYTLRAAVANREIGIVDDVSATFVIHPGPPAALAFGVHPSNTTPGAIIAPPVTVLVRDAFGNHATTATTPITLTIASNPGNGTLAGGGPINAVGGVAAFAGLSISAAGEGYTLQAGGGGLAAALSIPFRVIAVAVQPEPQPQPPPNLGLILQGDAQSSLLALLFRNSLCGLGGVAYLPLTVLGILGMRQTTRRRPTRVRRRGAIEHG